MQVVLVVGVKDAGKTTLLDELEALDLPASIEQKARRAVRRVDASALKRAIMKESPDRILRTFYDIAWRLFDQAVTERLSLAFYERLESTYGGDIVLVKDRMAYPQTSPDGDVMGYARVSARSNARHIVGIVHVVSHQHLVAMRRGHWNEERLVKYMKPERVTVAQASEDAIRDEIELERQEVNIANAAYDIPVLELRSFYSRASVGDQCKHGRPATSEHAKSAAEFIVACALRGQGQALESGKCNAHRAA